MEYWEINIETSESGIEPLLGQLIAAGFDDAAVRDPRDVEEIMDKKESYEWDYVEDSVVKEMRDTPRVTLYLPADEEADAQMDKIQAAVASLAEGLEEGWYGDVDFGSLEISSKKKDDKEWKFKWKEYFKPFRASDRLWVCPSWEELEDVPEERIIRIDPGMAFGTGTHETTSMCIEMIDEQIKPGQRVLDAGCGSGILSIAAAKLGAGDVLGVDVDPEAVRVAQENLEKNGVADAARAEYGDLTQGVGYEADLVAANLMAELLCMLTPGIYNHLTDGGLFISSGILEEKADMVTSAYADAGLKVLEVRHKGEWVCVLAQKPAAGGAEVR